MASTACSPAALKVPTLAGGQVLNLAASVLDTYGGTALGTTPSGAAGNSSAGVCNVTVTYTHPGQNDSISVEAWLPLSGWNTRLQAVGGAGFGAGRFPASYSEMVGAVAAGFAAVTTDAGTDPNTFAWATKSTGVADAVTTSNWGTVALGDMAVLGKALVAGFYGRAPAFSYFVGCSQGGRQGYELAQRYPAAFDGIAASAPGISWPEWDPAMLWPAHVMGQLGAWPFPCELDELTAAAVAACDSQDGIVDGILSNPDACAFDGASLVGKEFLCADTNATMPLSFAAAVVANATWNGPRSAGGALQWFGYNRGADLGGGSAATVCQRTNATGTEANATWACRANMHSLAYEWVLDWVEQDEAFDYANMTTAVWDAMMARSAAQWDPVAGSADPNLTAFRDAGGKMLTFHGLADNVIPTRGTEHYYTSVMDMIPDVRTFYRFFEAPGVGHCGGGPGGTPNTMFDALRLWVENGTAPDTLPVSFPVNGTTNHRILCPYPNRAYFDQMCGDPANATCFDCGESISGAGSPQ